jgi:hypothetical protein
VPDGTVDAICADEDIVVGDGAITGRNLSLIQSFSLFDTYDALTCEV